MRRDLDLVRKQISGRLLLLLALLFAPLFAPAAVSAQEQYNFTVGLLGGIGGSPDAEPGDDLGNTGYQLNLSMVTEPGTHVGFRLGQLGLDNDELFGSLREAELSYVTVGGEYRFRQGYYDSGLYLALGGYRLEGLGFDDQDESDTAIGLAVGVTGEFEINRWLSLVLELSGHYADFEESQIFGMGHGGFAIHF